MQADSASTVLCAANVPLSARTVVRPAQVAVVSVPNAAATVLPATVMRTVETVEPVWNARKMQLVSVWTVDCVVFAPSSVRAAERAVKIA